MRALVAGVHVFLAGISSQKEVDGRDKPGHDEPNKQIKMKFGHRLKKSRVVGAQTASSFSW